jgi:hypothetical protein
MTTPPHVIVALFGISRICAGQFQRYYYGLGNSAGSPGQNNDLPGEPEVNPRKVAQVMALIFMSRPYNVKSMTPDLGIFFAKARELQ